MSEVSFQLEPWSAFLADPATAGLWQEELEELAGNGEAEHGIAPNLGMYAALDESGKLVLVTARKAGLLIGYCLVMISQHPHFPVFCGFEDLFFLTKAERRGMTAVRLVERTRAELARLGCQKVYWMAPEHTKVGMLYGRLGMKPAYTMYVDKLTLEN